MNFITFLMSVAAMAAVIRGIVGSDLVVIVLGLMAAILSLMLKELVAIREVLQSRS